MVEALEHFPRREQFSFDVVDVDKDAALAARYGDKVPVLMGEDDEICHYFFDPSALHAYLDKIR